MSRGIRRAHRPCVHLAGGKSRVGDRIRRVRPDLRGILRRESKGGFPEKVTAFHAAMAVHGRFKQPCPVCGAPVQRIVYATNECNYCAVCQNNGRRLADRAMSRLLKNDWPRTLDDR